MTRPAPPKGRAVLLARLLQVGNRLVQVGSRLLTDEGGAPCCCDTPEPGGYIFAFDCYILGFVGWEPGFPYPTQYVPPSPVPVIAIPDTFRCDVNGTPCPLVWGQVVRYQGRCYRVYNPTVSIFDLPMSPCGNGELAPSEPLDGLAGVWNDPVPVADTNQIECAPDGCATAECIQTTSGTCDCIYDPAPWRTCPGDTQLSCYRGYTYMVTTTTRARSQVLEIDGNGRTEFWTQSIDSYYIVETKLDSPDICQVRTVKRYTRVDTRFVGTSPSLGSYDRRIIQTTTQDFPNAPVTVTTSTGGTNNPIAGIFEIGGTCAQMNAAVGPPCSTDPENPQDGSTGYNRTVSNCYSFEQKRVVDSDVVRFIGDGIQCVPFTRSEIEVRKNIAVLLGCNQPAPIIGNESFGGESAASIFARLVGGGA